MTASTACGPDHRRAPRRPGAGDPRSGLPALPRRRPDLRRRRRPVDALAAGLAGLGVSARPARRRPAAERRGLRGHLAGAVPARRGGHAGQHRASRAGPRPCVDLSGRHVVAEAGSSALADGRGELASLDRLVVGAATSEPVRRRPASGARPRRHCTGSRAAAPTHTVTDPAMVLFTSGTTGPVEGLRALPPLRRAPGPVDDRATSGCAPTTCCTRPFPLFHLDASVMTVMPALVLGTTAAIGERFSASGFWDEVRRVGATVFDFMGATLTMLHKRPPAPDDADNRGPAGVGGAGPGVRRRSSSSASACSLVEALRLDRRRRSHLPTARRAAPPGQLRSRRSPQYDVAAVRRRRTVEVAAGEVGELVVRPNEPSLMSDGYYGHAGGHARVPAQPLVPHR